MLPMGLFFFLPFVKKEVEFGTRRWIDDGGKGKEGVSLRPVDFDMIYSSNNLLSRSRVRMERLGPIV
jgi:hypothetical protein